MKSNEWTWKSEDGVEIYSRGWEPENPKAIVCLVHGLGEHSGRYSHMGKVFAEAGFALVAFDLRGHGKSGGKRGHFPSLDAVMDDIRQLIQQGSEKFPGLPVFLYGHSLGALLVLNYATYHKHALHGVIVSGAALRTPVLEQKGKLLLVKILGDLLPTMTIPSGLDANGLSHEPEVLRAYRADPLVHDAVTLSTAQIGVSAVDRAFAHATKFPVPLLLIHGGSDLIVYPRGSQEFAALVPEKAEVKIWDGLYHEVHNEPQQAEVFAFVIEWMNSQLRNK